MLQFNKKTFVLLAAAFLLAWVTGKYLLPPAMPFLLGLGLALAAEPVTGRLSARLPRPAAAAIGVTLALVLMGALVVLLSSLLLRSLGQLGEALPQLSKAAGDGLHTAEVVLLRLAEKSPPELRPVLSGSVTRLLGSGSGLLNRLVDRLPDAAGAVLSWVPGSALTLGTGILSGYMIAFRLPKFREYLQNSRWVRKALPMSRQLRTALGGWLKAQLQLAGVCFAILGLGLSLLRIPRGLLWAGLITLVDAVPLLGTGAVLLPWAVICLLQGQQLKALGLAAICVTAMVCRSILEPRLLGKHLGLDPLVTLAALYAGFRLWGFGGMLLAPILCVAALSVSGQTPGPDTGSDP